MRLIRSFREMAYIRAITVAVADVLPTLFTIKGEMVFELIGRGRVDIQGYIAQSALTIR